MSQRHYAEFYTDIVGADSGDENENDDADNLDDDDLDEDEDDDNDGEEVTVESLQEKLAAAEEERERVHRRMRRADRAKSKADAELAALREGGQRELAEARDEVERLRAEVASLKGEDSVTTIREEFRDSALFEWHNPKLAFSLLDISDVDVEEGKVDPASLKDAVSKLAKEHPYLVKKSDPNGSDDEGDDEDKTPKRRSGTHTQPANKRDKRRSSIAAKYGIRGRI